MDVIKQYNSVDLFKFIMAFCVVTIHTNVIGIIDNILIRRVAFMIVHCAVPFFFIVSSYFLSIKDFSNWGGYFEKLIKLYVKWSLIHFIVSGIINENFSLNSLLDFAHQLVFIGYVHLWYIWGVLIVLPILLQLLKKKKLKASHFLILSFSSYILLRLVLFYGYHFNLPYSKFVYAAMMIVSIKNILIAMTYLSMGIFIANYNITPLLRNSCILVGVLIALLNIDKSGNEISLYVPLISFGLFSVVIEIRMSGSKNIFKWFRQMSSYIYFIHGVVICLVAKALIMPSIENWFSVVIITFIISSLIVYIKSKGILNWI